MIVTSGNGVDGRVVADYLGVVRGVVVRVPTRRQRIRGATEALMEGGNNRYFLERPRGTMPLTVRRNEGGQNEVVDQE